MPVVVHGSCLSAGCGGATAMTVVPLQSGTVFSLAGAEPSVVSVGLLQPTSRCLSAPTFPPRPPSLQPGSSWRLRAVPGRCPKFCESPGSRSSPCAGVCAPQTLTGGGRGCPQVESREAPPEATRSGWGEQPSLRRRETSRCPGCLQRGGKGGRSWRGRQEPPKLRPPCDCLAVVRGHLQPRSAGGRLAGTGAQVRDTRVSQPGTRSWAWGWWLHLSSVCS